MQHGELGGNEEIQNTQETQEEGEQYRESANVNGLQIEAGWDQGYGDYTIYLPQIQVGKEPGIYDQVVRISEKAADAKNAFAFAKQLAEQGMSPEDIWVELKEWRPE